MSTTTSEKKPMYRLFVLPWGLYPRRVTIYIKEKGISDIEVIPVSIGPKGMTSPAGRPPGSVPVLEIAPPSADGTQPGRYIYQSTAILEYLEDVYSGHGPCMLGSTPDERARTRDCMAVLDEAVAFFACYGHNASAMFSTMEPQCEKAAQVSLTRAHKLFSQLERLADPVGPFLVAAGDQLTIVDCIAMATLQFAKEVYGVDIAVQHPRIRTMYEAFVVRPSAAWDAPLPQEYKEMARTMSVR